MSRVMSSASTLSFVGDAYFGLLVRLKLSETERPVGELHSLSVKLVNANSQAKGFEVIKPFLSEEEMSVYKRGRNLHTQNTPKNSSVAQYHSATGLEALFGFLKLSGEEKRAEELFNMIWKANFGV